MACNIFDVRRCCPMVPDKSGIDFRRQRVPGLAREAAESGSVDGRDGALREVKRIGLRMAHGVRPVALLVFAMGVFAVVAVCLVRLAKMKASQVHCRDR